MEIQGPAPRDARCSDCGRGSFETHLVPVKLLIREHPVWLCALGQPCITLTVQRYRPPKLPPASPWRHPLDDAES